MSMATRPSCEASAIQASSRVEAGHRLVGLGVDRASRRRARRVPRRSAAAPSAPWRRRHCRRHRRAFAGGRCPAGGRLPSTPSPKTSAVCPSGPASDANAAASARRLVRLRRLQLRVGLDRRRVDAARLGDALGERGELHRLEEGDEPPRIELRPRGSRRAASRSRRGSRASPAACDRRAWSAIADQRSRRFGCLISSARASSVSRSPYSPISCEAVLTPMPGTPGHVVGGVADQRLDVDHLLRRHAEIVDDALASRSALGPVAGPALRCPTRSRRTGPCRRRAASGPCRRR